MLKVYAYVQTHDLSEKCSVGIQVTFPDKTEVTLNVELL